MSALRTIIAMSLCGLALAVTACDDELVPAAPVEDTGAPSDDVAETSSDVAVEPDAGEEVGGDSGMHHDGHMADGDMGMDAHEVAVSDSTVDGSSDVHEDGHDADAHSADAADAAHDAAVEVSADAADEG